MQRTLTNLFELVRDGDCLIVIPTADLRETTFEQRHEETAEVLAALDEDTTRHIVWDFHRTREFGSTALGFFVKLWKRICERRGRMAFCCLSPYEKDILHITKLDQLWPLCDDLPGALRIVRE